MSEVALASPSHLRPTKDLFVQEGLRCWCAAEALLPRFDDFSRLVVIFGVEGRLTIIFLLFFHSVIWIAMAQGIRELLQACWR